MVNDDVIEGELAEDPRPESRAVQVHSDSPVFNPLDAEPASFSNQLQTRQDNYDNLQLHLQGVLVANKDFGKIHVAKNCDNKYNCDIPGHFSGWTLFAPGADKILGILGLAVHYPDLQDYKRATLKGYSIEEVIVDCQILGLSDQVIAEGAGACARNEVKGSLNNCIKRACKRARLDAVMRLPVVSALFEGDFLEQMAAAQAEKAQRTAAERAQRIRNVWNTGARLEVCPIGKEIKGKPWREIATEALEWIVANVDDKPDVLRAAQGELTRRQSGAAGSSICNPESPTNTEEETNGSE